MNWPDYYPQNCPPDDAIRPSGIVFRLTDRIRPKERDFKPYYITKKEPNWEDDCQACGVSVYTDLEDVHRLRRRSPGARRKQIARGTLYETDGLIKHTPGRETPSHHSWWIFDGCTAWERFENVASPMSEL